MNCRCPSFKFKEGKSYFTQGDHFLPTWDGFPLCPNCHNRLNLVFTRSDSYTNLRPKVQIQIENKTNSLSLACTNTKCTLYNKELEVEAFLLKTNLNQFVSEVHNTPPPLTLNLVKCILDVIPALKDFKSEFEYYIQHKKFFQKSIKETLQTFQNKLTAILGPYTRREGPQK